MEPAAIERTFDEPNRSLHDAGPHAPRRPELGDLLEQLRPGREEEAQAGGDVVDVEAAGDGGVEVGDPSARVNASSWAAVAPASRMW